MCIINITLIHLSLNKFTRHQSCLFINLNKKRNSHLYYNTRGVFGIKHSLPINKHDLLVLTLLILFYCVIIYKIVIYGLTFVKLIFLKLVQQKMEAFEPKLVHYNYIKYGVNSLRLGSFYTAMDLFCTFSS